MLTHERPLILLTNDDGIHSPGLRAALAALCPLGDLLAAAPLHQHSGAGRSFPNGSTGRIHPVTLEWDGETLDAYGIEGSPAQSVAHALLELAPRLPDLAVVGINYGENVGNDITGSGTVGAALEAASAGIPTLAVSLQTGPEYYFSHSPGIDFRVSGQWACVFAARLLVPDYRLPLDGDVLNVNVPQDATLDTPWRVTRVSRCRYRTSLPPRRENLTDSYPLDYRVRSGWQGLEPDSDIQALACDHVVSVSPISLDLSSRVDRSALEKELADRSSSQDMLPR